MNWRRAGILLFAWTLTGCATPRPPVQTDAFWSGRLALQVQSEPPQQWFANFELQGTAEQGELLLLSPIGTTLAKLSWTPIAARLEQSGGSVQSNNLSSLSERLTGTALPIAALFEWLAGRPAQVQGWQADLSGHAQGHLQAQRTQPAPATALRIVLDQ
ncbi:lipoprotein insertase outer membrane protein LolB [Limnohabitans sp.]